jgi:hypothetical protein
MKVVGVSVPKTSYKPGDSVVATVTVQRGVETGGVVYLYMRRTGQVWQAGPVVTVGNSGLGIPDIFASGKLQTVSATFTLSNDASGAYQIGAREQSESTIGVQGVASFNVIASTPTPSLVQSTAIFTPNRTDVKDAVIYVDGTPVGILASWGTTVVLTPGMHVIRADGSLYSADAFTVTLTGGKTTTIPINLGLKSAKKSSTGGTMEIGVNAQTFALVGVAAAIGLGIVYLALRED